MLIEQDIINIKDIFSFGRLVKLSKSNLKVQNEERC